MPRVVHVATPAAPGAIARILWQGDACPLLDAHVQPFSGHMRSGVPEYALLRDGVREIDRLVLTLSPDGGALDTHGNPGIVREVVSLFERYGFAVADERAWGRAIGRNSLEIEAEQALREATAPERARILLWQRNGALAQAILTIGNAIATGNTAQQVEPLERLLGTASWGMRLAATPLVVLIGRPNAGKSSLANAFANRAGSFVSATPGSTRDPVTTQVTHSGQHAAIVDVAGIAFHGDRLARKATARSLRRARQADLALLCVDGQAGFGDLEWSLCRWLARRDVDFLLVRTKADLPHGADAHHVPTTTDERAVSALDGTGLPELRDVVFARLRTGVLKGCSPEPGGCLFTARQKQLLESALAALKGGHRAVCLDALARVLNGPLAGENSAHDKT